MSPLEFLKEEFENVQRALRETLRHDYGPEQSGDYYKECEERLADIGSAISNIAPTDSAQIRAYLGQLSHVAAFVSLIERSRLGEFSWPFADELRRISKQLLTETNLKGDLLDPIVHVVAEGHGYRIFYEPQVPVASSRRRFLVVAFPRSLKHHVLLHTLFGHEVGHTAIFTALAGGILTGEVLTALLAASPLKNLAAMNAWLNSAAAPQEVKDELAHYAKHSGGAFAFTEESRRGWLIELICDLFGLLLFGPAFFAAHRAYLEPLHPKPYAISTANPTHPPFATRHKMLVRTMHVANWHTPITSASDGKFHAAETETLRFLLNENYSQWATLFDDAALKKAAAGITKIFAPHGAMSYSPINSDGLVAMISRLTKGIPPIIADIDQDGMPVLRDVNISQTLYAGWVYWIGRHKLSSSIPLDFFNTNRLCDHALLQQRAINRSLTHGIV